VAVPQRAVDERVAEAFSGVEDFSEIKRRRKVLRESKFITAGETEWDFPQAERWARSELEELLGTTPGQITLPAVDKIRIVCHTKADSLPIWNLFRRTDLPIDDIALILRHSSEEARGSSRLLKIVSEALPSTDGQLLRAWGTRIGAPLALDLAAGKVPGAGRRIFASAPMCAVHGKIVEAVQVATVARHPRRINRRKVYAVGVHAGRIVSQWLESPFWDRLRHC
jgi:hypothetical protein